MNGIQNLAIDRAAVQGLFVDSLVGAITSLKGRDARRLAGTFVLTFPDYEEPGRSIYAFTEVRRFLREIYDRIPFFLYFQHPDRMMGGSLSIASAYARDEDIAESRSGIQIAPSEELFLKLVERLSDAAIYAARNGDDWRHFLDKRNAFDTPLQSAAAQLTEARLNTSN